MTTIREAANDYEQERIENISDLKKVDVNLDISERVFNKDDRTEFKVLVTTIDDIEYRVPKSVLAQVKVLLEEIPDMQFFKVRKSGEGMNTKYTVIPA